MARRNILIDGVSGSGKTSVCLELKKRGYDVVNGDNELAYHGDPETGEKTESRGHHTWIWDLEKVYRLVEDKSIDLMFFCGGARNLKKYLKLFDDVFILDADNETIKQRLLTRPGDKWGKKPSELELVMRLNETKEDIPSEGVSIDATQPLEKVVDTIIHKSTA